MKRNFINVSISILLILVSLAAICAAGWGGVECYALRELKNELPDMLDAIDELEKTVELVAENEDVYYDGIELCYEGDAKLLAGNVAVSEGRAKVEEGRARMAEAQAAYDEAVAQLEVGKTALAEAQAKMDEARPQYEEGKDQLQRLERLQPLLQTFCNFKNGVLADIPGFDDLTSWYRTAVVPYAATLGISLPDDIDKFAESMDRQIAEGNAKLEEYETAEAQLAEAQAAIDEADAQLAEAKRVLDEKNKTIDDAAREIDGMEGELSYAASKLAEGKASLEEFEDAVAKLEEAVVLLIETKPVCDRLDNVAVEGVAARLGDGFNLYKYNDEGEILSLTNGNPRLDYDKCLEVCQAYRDYVKDYQSHVGRELIQRAVLDGALLIASVLAIVAAIKALRGKASAAKLSVVLFVLLVLCNAFGAAVGYTSFAHPDGKLKFTGLVPLAGIAAMTVMSVLFMLACLGGRRKFLKLADADEAADNAPEEQEKPAENKELSADELEELNKSKLEYEAALQKYVEVRKKFKD